MHPVPPGEFLPPEPRIWPMFLGILGLLWGMISLAGSIFALVSLATGGQPGLAPELRDAFGTTLTVLGTLVVLLLCVGCVQLLRSKPSGIRLLRLWVPACVLAGALNLAFMIHHREPMERAMTEALQAEMEKQKEAGAPGVKFPDSAVRFFLNLQFGCTGVMVVVPPLIMAIFVFGRRGGEALAEWSETAQVS